MLCARLLLMLPNGRIVLSREVIRPKFTFFTKTFSSKARTSVEESFMVSYLISSCGLSPEAATTASKKVHFSSAEEPDAVLTFLRKYGFTDAHISKAIRSQPRLLLANPEKTLLPKIEFFRSMGLPNPELTNILTSCVNLLFISLENKILPMYNFLRTVSCLDDKKVHKYLNRWSWIFGKDLEYIEHRVTVLRNLGVCSDDLSRLVRWYPHVLRHNREQFDELVKKVTEMGFIPAEARFIRTLAILSRYSKSTLERKTETYRKCGWSDNEIQAAFRMQPFCMTLSEKKITTTVDFLVNKMGWEPTAIAKVPTVLMYSLQKRIIPRCLVIKILKLKGLVEKDLAFSTLLIRSNKYFSENFVTRYEKDVPQLLSIFKGQVNPALCELGFESLQLVRSVS